MYYPEKNDLIQIISFGLKYYSDKLEITQILLRHSEQKFTQWVLWI